MPFPAQVYGDGEQFKLHDVVEVLGVVSVLPSLAAAHMQQEGQQDMDMDAWQEELGAHPPTSKVGAHAAHLTAQLFAV